MWSLSIPHLTEGTSDPLTPRKLNEAVEYLITFYEENKKSQKNVQLLFSLLGSAKGIREELERSRREDEGSSLYWSTS
jgi:hypothetical protein